ncbi:MAG: hypothetical protein ACLSH6_05310 [Limosilactobacillus pontis]
MDGETKSARRSRCNPYYRDGFNQQEIASEPNISRATVSSASVWP